jgi:hypothetical protein
MGGHDEWDLSDDMDIDDLFEDRGSVGVDGMRHAFDVETIGRTDASFASVMELSPELELRYKTDDDADGTIYLRGSVTSRRDKPVEIESLVLVARAADGRLLDYREVGLQIGEAGQLGPELGQRGASGVGVGHGASQGTR